MKLRIEINGRKWHLHSALAYEKYNFILLKIALFDYFQEGWLDIFEIHIGYLIYTFGIHLAGDDRCSPRCMNKNR